MKTINRKELANKFTEIVASSLHCQDFLERGGRAPTTAYDVMRAQEGSVDRYRRDPRFNARVDSMVAALLAALP